MLSNLVTNAIKFTQAGGVTLTADLTVEGAVIIRVRDTGVGMTPESLEHIFDEFRSWTIRSATPLRGGDWGWPSAAG